MASVVSICNLALSNVGKENINSLDEASSEARACRQFYPHVRDILLQVYPWSFAGKSKSLAEVTNDKQGDWLHAYDYPTDCLKVRWIRPVHSNGGSGLVAYRPNGSDFEQPYAIEGGRIYCNISPAVLYYTVRETDPSRYPAMFIEALAWNLAVRLALPMTRDPKVRADAYQLAMQAQNAAAMVDANEVRETSDHTSEFIAGRF